MKKTFQVEIKVPRLADCIEIYSVSCLDSEYDQVVEQLKWDAYNEDFEDTECVKFLEQSIELGEVDSNSKAEILSKTEI